MTVKTFEDYMYFLFNDKEGRKEFKKYHLQMQRYILSNKDFTIKPATAQEYKERKKDVELLEESTIALKLVEVIESYKKNKLQNCRFKLYKKGKQIIIANTYKNEGERKTQRTFHFMPNGLPIRHKIREKKYRDKFSFRGFKLIDEGRFYQVFDTLKGSKISYSGKKYRFRIKYRQYGYTQDHVKYWAEMMKYKKIN
jgi:hypothetical protein